MSAVEMSLTFGFGDELFVTVSAGTSRERCGEIARHLTRALPGNRVSFREHDKTFVMLPAKVAPTPARKVANA